LIQLRDLTVHYGPVAALDGITLDIAQGECVLVTGPSGCGKTTLARVLTGLIPQALPAQVSGTVTLDGQDVLNRPLGQHAQRVGLVFQNPSTQLFHLRAADDVAFGPRNLGLAEDEVQRRVAWALEAVGATELAAYNPAELSGGQKQLVALAAALAMRPRVLVLDEPTSSLDVDGTSRVMAALRQLRQETGLTLVIVEHRLAEAARLADRMVLMEEGAIVAVESADRLLGDLQLLRRLGLRRPVDEAQQPWHELLTANGPPPAGQEPLLAFQRVSAGYGRQAVIHDVELALYPGEFVALVGDNGAGKSTLALTAAGLLRPLQGAVRYGPRRRVRPGLDVSLLFQDPTDQLFTNTVNEEVAFGPRNYHRFQEATHQGTLAATGLATLRERHPAALSLGQQQRTALAACLSLRPGLLILDEPTLGQDWRHLARFMDYLAALNRRGATILLITHDYKLVHRYAQRVILMEGGRVALDGQLLQAPVADRPSAVYSFRSLRGAKS